MREKQFMRLRSVFNSSQENRAQESDEIKFLKKQPR